MSSEPNSVKQVLDAVGDCLNGASAEALLRLRAGEDLQLRLDELADRCTEGELSPAEREEYESLVNLIDFVSLLQAQARRRMAAGQAA